MSGQHVLRVCLAIACVTSAQKWNKREWEAVDAGMQVVTHSAQSTKVNEHLL